MQFSGPFRFKCELRAKISQCATIDLLSRERNLKSVRTIARERVGDTAIKLGNYVIAFAGMTSEVKGL